MREPNIKEMLESLATEDFIEKVFKYRDAADAEITQLLYFMQKEQTVALYAEISQMDEARKNCVLTSLTRLYPLSKHIVFHLLAKLEETPLDFLNAYDMDKVLLRNIQRTLKEIKDSSNSVSILFNDYCKEVKKENEDIEQLKDAIKQMNDVSIQVKEQRSEKQCLQKQLDILRQEFKSGNLDADIKELKDEIAELSLKKEKKIRQKQKLDQELKELQKDMSLKEEIYAREYQKAYLELEKCIKNIVEG